MAQTISLTPSSKMIITPFQLLNTYLNIPDVKGRENILKIHVKKMKLEKSLDLSIIAKRTSGFTGAEDNPCDSRSHTDQVQSTSSDLQRPGPASTSKDSEKLCACFKLVSIHTVS
jgi:SpoVK/Ycf46/Vps4 family AAA+-type ATPase